MILIYTNIITPRVRYIFKHIFTRILKIDIDFTSKVEDFVAHNGAKMSYAKMPLGSEFFVKSHTLLFEQGITDIDISVSKWDTIPCFFKMGKKSAIPFDIFSASFYLITRYEEYLPHVKDKHGRFTAKQSLAFQNGFLEKPVIDIWAYKLLSILKERFHNYSYKKRKYKYISTINVNNAYAYKHKGMVRSIGGFLKDLSSFQILNLIDRIAVISNLKKDPFNTFKQLISLQKKYNIKKTIFFFLIGEYNEFDTNISPSRTKFQLLIKDMVDYARVGLHPSYYTKDVIELLKKEKNKMEDITHMPMIRSCQHYLRFEIPKTYQHLIDLEIEEDYSMGYATHTGFRASTCTPFYFYDIDFEIQTPLKIFPFTLMDSTLTDHMKLTPKQSIGKIRDLKKQVYGVNGTFITLFHNESISGYSSRWFGWRKVYEAMLKIATEK